MAEEWKCPFCGSNKLRYDAPYVELSKSGTYEPKQAFCCKQQQANHRFVKRYDEESRPDPEEVGKWD